MAWNIPDEKREALVAWITAIALDPSTRPAVAVKAFRALVEASKVGLMEAAVKAVDPKGVFAPGRDDVIEGIVKLVDGRAAGESVGRDERGPDVGFLAGAVELLDPEPGPLAEGSAQQSRHAG